MRRLFVICGDRAKESVTHRDSALVNRESVSAILLNRLAQVAIMRFARSGYFATFRSRRRRLDGESRENRTIFKERKSGEGYSRVPV